MEKLEPKKNQGMNEKEVSLVEDYPLLYQVLCKISTALAETLGSSCEVNVHDLKDPTSSIVHINNGHVTGRQIGDPIMDMAVMLRNERFSDDMLTNYIKRTPDGKVLKSMSVVIRDDNKNIIGSFGMNFDVGKLLNAKSIIEDFTKGYELQENKSKKSVDDDNVIGILRHIIRKTIEEAGIPISEMSREDKVEIVKFLSEKEIFLIKGAVNYVADTLNVSRYTIYNYLEEIRTKKFEEK